MMRADDGKGCDAALAACIFAVDPAALGGIRLRGRSGPSLDRLTAQIRTWLPASAPFRKLPLSIADNRLIGGLDLAATLQAGRPVLERGMLADCHGGVISIASAERMTAQLAAKLAAALDTHEVAIERDGFAARSRCCIGMLVLDEGIEPDESPPPILLERLGLQVAADERDTSLPFEITDIENARRTWRGVKTGDDLLGALCQSASMLGVASARAPVLALCVARIHAALHRRGSTNAEDAMAAARLVYALRATMMPSEAAPPDEPPPEQEQENEKQPEPNAPLEDIVIEAVRAAIPPDLLAQLRPQSATSARAGVAGTAGQQRKARRGRPIGSRAGDLSAGSKLHVIDTLRSAAPWQMLRRRTRPDTDTRRVIVSRDDFRITRFRHHSETLTIFVVDASGSSAIHRLAEAKGAVELLLADCYVRRDQVALIAFRGQGAELLLPPTRSLTRAKRSLGSLPGGGGTPLALAIDAARLLCEQSMRKGQTPVVVMLTDGRGNIARDGSQGREAAERDSLAAARAIRATGVTSLMVDTSPSPHPAARKLAGDMSARYLPLPRADAAMLSGAVRAAL